MKMMAKNRFGANMMIFLFLLSFYNATAVDVSGVSYIPLNVNNLENQLNNKINEAKRQDQPFYVGVAKEDGNALQSLCKRQGAVILKNTNRCTRSDHKADEKAEEEHGTKLMTVFYARSIMKESEICGIEKRLIDTYWILNKDPLCLNEAVGHLQCCIQSYSGIVYLRIYEKKPQSPKKIKTKSHYWDEIMGDQ